MKTKMSKLFALVLAAVMLTAVLSACDISIGNNQSGGGTSTPGTTSNTAPTTSGGDTAEPSDTSKPPSAPPSVGDPVSVNALVGLWGTRGYATLYIWAFGKDGNFAYYKATYTDSPTRTTEYFSKGKYRVNGDNIEFYDCQDDHQTIALYRHWKYFGDDPPKYTADTMLNTPLEDPKKADDFSILFEFIDTKLLRIVIDRGDKYDMDFGYVGDSHNIVIPTHSLPGVAWPKNQIPFDAPEYVNGRVRSVSTNSSGNELHVVIDRTTRKDMSEYVERLRQAGWSPRYGEADLKAALEGINTNSSLGKDDYKIAFEFQRDDCVKLIFY